MPTKHSGKTTNNEAALQILGRNRKLVRFCAEKDVPKWKPSLNVPESMAPGITSGIEVERPLLVYA